MVFDWLRFIKTQIVEKNQEDKREGKKNKINDYLSLIYISIYSPII